jgi:hypothetical protein
LKTKVISKVGDFPKIGKSPAFLSKNIVIISPKQFKYERDDTFRAKYIGLPKGIYIKTNAIFSY